MQILSIAEINERFKPFTGSSPEEIRCDGRELFFAHPEAGCIDIEYPSKAEGLPFLARCLATLGYEPEHFRGALLWFTEWGVWQPLDEGIGYRIIEAMNSASGQPKSFEASPGHLFRADELQEAIAMLLQPMIFSWDALFVPSWSYGYHQFFLHVSHDSFFTVVTRTKEFYDKAFARLRELELNPKPGHEHQIRRFCRLP